MVTMTTTITAILREDGLNRKTMALSDMGGQGAAESMSRMGCAYPRNGQSRGERPCIVYTSRLHELTKSF